jgi:hypothetical protein
MPEPATVFPPPPPEDFEEPASLVDRAAALKERLDDMTEELRRLNLVLAEKAVYKPGSRTGRLLGRRFAATVHLKEYVKWDQDFLNGVRQALGDEEFFKIFKWTFEPRNAKALAGALEFGRHGRLVDAARAVTPGRPQVAFDRLEHQTI